MTKTLFHVTPRVNVQSILDLGLLVEASKGRSRRVWLCDADRLPWAVSHIANHHGVRAVDLSILHVNVNQCEVSTIRKGVYATHADVPSKWIGDVVYYALGEPE